ncbi:GNAT family N-acetyltransferase [Phenylobacterium aquaticum]|uniref:GNAT family N-acetyltransferase n=1 Tax=Phenylobacterium aquaticum TaxID=1763816 RepID=UPI001F5C3BA4|nr:GNAT family N-acetyltransferase [Phenylobacterium aquaticum]MCI3132937.1 GNAT family N-acetyltransferase [Phenylobacterium aquaticum]
MTLIIEQAERPDDAYMPIWAPLLQFNQAAVGDAQGIPFALTIRSRDAPEVLGGLWALSLWGSFYVGLLVAPEGFRGQGLGSELLARGEAEAQARGCRHMWLDTYAFQARAFYERHGFAVFGQIDGPAPMFPRWFMQKMLPLTEA